MGRVTWYWKGGTRFAAKCVGSGKVRDQDEEDGSREERVGMR